MEKSILALFSASIVRNKLCMCAGKQKYSFSRGIGRNLGVGKTLPGREQAISLTW